MPGPHYISQKPDKARARYVPKPAGFFESPNRLDYKDFKLTFPNHKAIMQISEARPDLDEPDRLKAKYGQARARPEPESLSPSRPEPVNFKPVSALLSPFQLYPSRF